MRTGSEQRRLAVPFANVVACPVSVGLTCVTGVAHIDFGWTDE